MPAASAVPCRLIAVAIALAAAGCAKQNNPLDYGGDPVQRLIGHPLPPLAARPAAQPYPQRQPQAYPAPAYPAQAYSPQAHPPQSPAGAAAEAQMRQQLMQQATGFGGLFGPSLNQWVNSPGGGGGGGGGDDCAGRYNDYGAQQACRSGHGWAADRLENHESDGAERDWYNN